MKRMIKDFFKAHETNFVKILILEFFKKIKNSLFFFKKKISNLFSKYINNL